MLPEERNSLLFSEKWGGERGRRDQGLGKTEFPGSMHEGLLVTTALQVNPAQGQYWSTGSKG
jgi:hypothetical protein